MAYISSTTNTGSNTSAVGNKPASLVNGYVLIAFVATNIGDQVPTLAGWTTISRSAAGNEPAAGLFYRVVDGSEPASWTWALAAYADWIVQIAAYSQIDTAAPIHAQSASWSRAYGATSAAGLTTTSTSTLIQVACVGNQTGGYTWNAALTERQDQQGYYLLAGMADRVDAPAGTYSYTATSTGVEQWQHGYMLALKPASGGGGSVALAAALAGTGNLAAALTVSGGTSVALAAALAGQGNLAAALSVTGGGSVPLAAALAGQGNLAAALSVSTPGGWEATDVYRELADRYQPILLTATAGQGYIATSLDSEPTGTSTWRYFSGPLASDGITLTEVASEAAARAAALALPTASSGRWDLPQLVEARTVRLGWRANTGAFILREFYADRVVEGDQMRAGSVTTRVLAAGAVTADILAAGAVTAENIQARAIDGMVITGATYRTSAGPDRIEFNSNQFDVIVAGSTRVRLDTSGLKTFDSGGNIQVEATTDTNGALTFGGRNGIADRLGLRIVASSSGTYNSLNSLSWVRAADGLVIGSLFGFDSGENFMRLEAPGTATRRGMMQLIVGGENGAPGAGVSLYGGEAPFIQSTLSLSAQVIACDHLNVGTAAAAAPGAIRAAVTSDDYYSILGPDAPQTGKRGVVLSYSRANDQAELYAVHQGTTLKPLRMELSAFGWGTTPVARPTVTGSRGGNAALASLLTALANLGWIVNSTTA